MFECHYQPLTLPEPLAAELVAAYDEPHRGYHNLDHIHELLGWFDNVYATARWKQPGEVYVAMLFHDAIYVAGAKDNEAKSAAWAKRTNLPVDLDRVAHLIELTAAHGKLDGAALAGDVDAQHFLDADMAILAAPPERFAEYDAGVAKEYASIPPAQYAAGRRAFLDKLRAQPRIFFSEHFHSRLDPQARRNLSAALAR